jgi:hypothetical protein
MQTVNKVSSAEMRRDWNAFNRRIRRGVSLRNELPDAYEYRQLERLGGPTWDGWVFMEERYLKCLVRWNNSNGDLIDRVSGAAARREYLEDIPVLNSYSAGTDFEPWSMYRAAITNQINRLEKARDRLGLPE